MDCWVLVPSSYKKRLKNHLLGSLALVKEVVFPVCCMANDETIIVELEAGSRRPHLGGGVCEVVRLTVKSGTLWRCS